MSNPLKKLVGQTAIYGISSIIGRFLNYLLVPFYTRIFTTEQYGIVTEMYAYVAFLIVVLTYGMETAFFKFSSGSEEKDRVFSTALISIISTSFVFIALCTLFSDSLGNVLGYPNHTEYVIWFAIIIGLDAISAIPLARLRELQLAKTFMGVNLANIGINLGLNIFFLVYCRDHFVKYGGDSNWLVSQVYNPEIGVGYVFISNLIASIFKLALLTPFMFMVKLVFVKSIWKKMIPYAMPLMILGLAGIVNEAIDRLMLKHMLPMGERESLEQLGIYGACYKISILMMLFIQAFRYAAEPFFFSQQNENNAKEIYARVMNYFILACAFIFLGINLFLEEVMLFIGEDFREGKSVVPVLLLANLCFGVLYNLSIWYKLTEKTQYGAIISIVGALVTITLNYVLIPEIGYIGSAWATLACYASMMIISYIWSKKHYPVKYDIGKLLVYIILAIALFFLSNYFEGDTTIIKYAVNIALILFFLLISFLMNKKELRPAV